MKDEQLHKLLEAERYRQNQVINLIASENYVSPEVLQALGSEFVNKYAEGYPGKRYYGGNEVVDEVEELARERALEVFALAGDDWAVNVQPLSGTPANLAVYLGVLGAEKEKKIMGLSLDHGGHLSHGTPVSATGQFWTQIPYQVDTDSGQLDYDALWETAKNERPDILVVGFTAYSREINWSRLRGIADAYNIHLHVDMSHIAGLVAGGAYPSPFPYADTVMTTTHKTLRGPRSAIIFSRRDERELPRKIDKAIFPGLQGGPHINQVAATAVALKEARSKEFADYAIQVVRNAQTLASELQALGWPVISDGTDTHLFLIDTWQGGEGVTGRDASDKLEAEGIIVNKNAIPGDERKPANPSGIRLGTAAETTRGKTEEDMKEIAKRIDEVLRD